MREASSVNLLLLTKFCSNICSTCHRILKSHLQRVVTLRIYIALNNSLRGAHLLTAKKKKASFPRSSNSSVEFTIGKDQSGYEGPDVQPSSDPFSADTNPN